MLDNPDMDFWVAVTILILVATGSIMLAVA